MSGARAIIEDEEAQLRLFAAPPAECETCDDLGAIGVTFNLPGGQRSFRLDPCPDCAEERDLDPR